MTSSSKRRRRLMTKKLFIPLEELLEKSMRESDSTMKETIQDYLFLRKEAEGQPSLDALRKLLEES